MTGYDTQLTSGATARESATAAIERANDLAEHLKLQQDDALHDVNYFASSLVLELETVRTDADAAIRALRRGDGVNGMALGTGPLGHQRPFDIAALTSRLDEALKRARRLGCSPEAIDAAYTQPERGA